VQRLQRRVSGRRGLGAGISGRLGGEERLDLGREGRVDTEEVAGRGSGLAAVLVDEEGRWGAHRGKEDASEVGEHRQAFGVADVGVVERLDEQLAEELGDVDVIEEAREAASAATGCGAALAAGFGQGLLVSGVVEETEVAVGEGVGGAGVAIGFDEGAAGGGHGVPPVGRCSGVQVFRCSGVQMFWIGKGRARARARARARVGGRVAQRWADYLDRPLHDIMSG
jgi:hypothetical protein